MNIINILILISLIIVIRSEAQIIVCDSLKVNYLRKSELKDSLRKGRQHIQLDSFYKQYLPNAEKCFPCDYFFAKNLYFSSYGLNFTRFNKREEALNSIQKKIDQCTNVNDTTTLFLYGRKGIYHLWNDQFLLMKQNLEKAILLGKSKFNDDFIDVYNAKMNLGLYYLWMNDLDKALDLYVENEYVAKNSKQIELQNRIINLQWIQEISLTINNEEIFTKYSKVLDSLTMNTKFEKEIAFDKNKLMFDNSLSKNDIEKAHFYYEKLNLKDDTIQEYEFELQIIEYLLKSNNLDKAKAKIIALENEYYRNNLPLHHFFWINLKLRKLKLASIEKQSEKQIKLVKEITTSLDNNFINLFNSNVSDQIKKINTIIGKYLYTLSLALDANDKESVLNIYDKMKITKNASASFFKIRNEYIGQSSNISLKNEFETLKKLTKTINESTNDEPILKTKNDSIAILNRNIEYKLDSVGIIWQNNYDSNFLINHLKDSEVVLDFYTLRDNRLIIFILSHNKFSYKIITNADRIKDDTELDINYVNNKYKNSELFNLIFAPLMSDITGKSKIYICPDAVTENIVFEILSPNGSKNYLLSDDFQFTYIENVAGIINEHKGGKPASSDFSLALFGGINYTCNTANQQNTKTSERNSEGNFVYLPGSEKEVVAIDSITRRKGYKSTLLKGCDATVDSLREFLENCEFNHIHISTHGINPVQIKSSDRKFDNLLKTYSRLLFSDNKNSEPYLTADELLFMSLSSKEIVFLSACNTGTGEYFPSYGNVSIANAFKKAGVKYVIATMWSIPDEITKEFCKIFYTIYLENHDIDLSMLKAKSELRKKYSPKNWAAFRILH